MDIKSIINHLLCTQLGTQQGMTFDASQTRTTQLFVTEIEMNEYGK
jgi:hypothetical protein